SRLKCDFNHVFHDECVLGHVHKCAAQGISCTGLIPCLLPGHNFPASVARTFRNRVCKRTTVPPMTEETRANAMKVLGIVQCVGCGNAIEAAETRSTYGHTRRSIFGNPVHDASCRYCHDHCLIEALWRQRAKFRSTLNLGSLPFPFIEEHRKQENNNSAGAVQQQLLELYYDAEERNRLSSRINLGESVPRLSNAHFRHAAELFRFTGCRACNSAIEDGSTVVVCADGFFTFHDHCAVKELARGQEVSSSSAGVPPSATFTKSSLDLLAKRILAEECRPKLSDADFALAVRSLGIPGCMLCSTGVHEPESTFCTEDGFIWHDFCALTHNLGEVAAGKMLGTHKISEHEKLALKQRVADGAVFPKLAAAHEALVRRDLNIIDCQLCKRVIRDGDSRVAGHLQLAGSKKSAVYCHDACFLRAARDQPSLLQGLSSVERHDIRRRLVAHSSIPELDAYTLLLGRKLYNVKICGVCKVEVSGEQTFLQTDDATLVVHDHCYAELVQENDDHRGASTRERISNDEVHQLRCRIDNGSCRPPLSRDK
ncbi:unnamed protein product, partial [Amoebophrya sp. A120]